MLPTYSDYTKSFGELARIPQSAYELMVRRAVCEINQYVSTDVAKLEADVANPCILEVAELLYDVLMRDGVISENTDGYSVTYGDRQVSIYSIIKKYLIGYLYRGVEL